MKLVGITDIDCPDCGVSRGQWCERHGETLGGALLACAARHRKVIRINKQQTTKGTNSNDN